MTKLQTLMLVAAGLAIAGCSTGTGPTELETPATELRADAPTENAEAIKTPTSEEPSKVDYEKAANWLCRPDSDQSNCETVPSSFQISNDGSSVFTSVYDAEVADIDCFYLYPTVSLDPTPNSDLIPGEEELAVVTNQLAPFGSVCRPFAPIYRQMTLSGLNDFFTAGQVTADVAMSLGDVIDAWNYYLEHYNEGRGVVLIGHSQGSSVLDQLVQLGAISKASQPQIVSMMLVGGNIYLDEDTKTYGGFPVCERIGQTQCVISYSSYPSDAPPVATSYYGVAHEDGRSAVCTNPAQLSGDNGYLSGLVPSQLYVSDQITLPEGGASQIALPDLMEAKCSNSDTHSYLQVSIGSTINDPRVAPLNLLTDMNGIPLADWGMHASEMAVTLQNLISIVDLQSDAWSSANQSE